MMPVMLRSAIASEHPDSASKPPKDFTTPLAASICL
jgi:hypothetical protein